MLSLIHTLISLSGDGHVDLYTPTDGAKYQCDLPFQNSNFFVLLGKAIMTYGRLDIRMHRDDGKTYYMEPCLEDALGRDAQRKSWAIRF